MGYLRAANIGAGMVRVTSFSAEYCLLNRSQIIKTKYEKHALLRMSIETLLCKLLMLVYIHSRY